MSKVIIVLGLFFMFASLAIGQKSEEDYAPPSSSALNEDASASPYGGSIASDELVKNIIQFNVTSLVRGNYYINYERAISKDFSFTVGAGGYFMTDAMGLLYLPLGGEESDYTTSTLIIDENFHLEKPNFQFGFSGKVFMDKYTDVRTYFEYGLRFYYATYINDDYMLEGSSTASIEKLSDVNQQLFVNYGRMWISGVGKTHFCHQFYVGAGIRRIVTDNVIYSYDSSIGNVYTADGTTSTYLAPSIILGYKLGFGW